MQTQLSFWYFSPLNPCKPPVLSSHSSPPGRWDAVRPCRQCAVHLSRSLRCCTTMSSMCSRQYCTVTSALIPIMHMGGCIAGELLPTSSSYVSHWEGELCHKTISNAFSTQLVLLKNAASSLVGPPRSHSPAFCVLPSFVYVQCLTEVMKSSLAATDGFSILGKNLKVWRLSVRGWQYIACPDFHRPAYPTTYCI